MRLIDADELYKHYEKHYKPYDFIIIKELLVDIENAPDINPFKESDYHKGFNDCIDILNGYVDSEKKKMLELASKTRNGDTESIERFHKQQNRVFIFEDLIQFMWREMHSRFIENQ